MPFDRTMLARTILRPSPDVQGTSMEGETVLLDLSTGRYYTLNRVGQRHLGVLYRPQHHERHPCGPVRPL